MKLAMLLLVLALCLPSYGDILVYKVSLAGRAIDIDAGEAYIGSGTFKGYMVVDVNFTDPEVPVITDDALVIYGKDWDGLKVQVTLDDVIGEYSQDPMEKIGNWAVAVEVDNVDIGDMVLIGKAKEIDIGFGTADKRIVATSLTGHGILWADPINEIVLTGSGKIIATLQSYWTKAYNAGAGTAFDEVVINIINVKLVSYADITPYST